jgi:predicted O-methyltransferase YrrM
MIDDDVIYGRAALNKGEPWITPGALEIVKEMVQPDWKVFEWGSGGGTAFWSRNCAKVISVEHDSDWIVHTANIMVRLDCPQNWALLYVRGKGIDHNTAFVGYSKAIDDYPNEYFDLVFIDGEASSRGWCLRNAMPKLKSGGIMLVDNSDWLEITPDGLTDRQDFIETGLHWVGNENTFDWWTSIFRKE